MCTFPVQPICTFSCTAHFISLHILLLILFHYLFLISFSPYLYIYSLVFCFIVFIAFMLFLFYYYFLLFFIFLHFPLNGPVLTNISLLIIPCMIVYVTNNKEPWTLNLVPTHSQIKLLFWLSCKVGEMSLTPFWFSPLNMQTTLPAKHHLYVWPSAQCGICKLPELSGVLCWFDSPGAICLSNASKIMSACFLRISRVTLVWPGKYSSSLKARGNLNRRPLCPFRAQGPRRESDPRPSSSSLDNGSLGHLGVLLHGQQTDGLIRLHMDFCSPSAFRARHIIQHCEEVIKVISNIWPWTKFSFFQLVLRGVCLIISLRECFHAATHY